MELKDALSYLRDTPLKDMDEENYEDAVTAVQEAIGDLEVNLYNARARVEELEPLLAVVPCPNPSEHEDAEGLDELHTELEKLRRERNELRVALATVRGTLGKLGNTVTVALARGMA